MQEKTSAPAIRFAGFSDDWEQRKLGEYCEMYNGDRSSKYPNAQDMVSDGIPFINAGDLEDGCVNLTTANKITREKYDDLGGVKLQFGDIVYCLRGTLGKNAYINNFTEGTVASSLVAIRPKNIDGRYLFHVLNSDIEYRQRILYDEGAAQPNLSAKNVSGFMIPIPDMDEQKKISACLDNLNNLITLHQRKYSRLCNIKRSMIERMFPREGATVPEIRFTGFTDAWEQRKTKDLCSISTGKSNTQDSVEDGMYPFYVRSQIVEHSNRYLFDEEAVLTVGDGVGTGKVFHYVNGKYDLHQRVYRMFDFSNEITAKYFYYYFSDRFYDRVMAMTAKTSVDSVRYEMIADMDIAVPKIQEQIAISVMFERFDHLITLHQRKLERLQNIKKAYLEKMFV